MDLGPAFLLTGFKVIDKESEGTQTDNPICSSRSTPYPFLPCSVAKEGDIYRLPQPSSLLTASRVTQWCSLAARSEDKSRVMSVYFRPVSVYLESWFDSPYVLLGKVIASGRRPSQRYWSLHFPITSPFPWPIPSLEVVIGIRLNVSLPLWVSRNTLTSSEGPFMNHLQYTLPSISCQYPDQYRASPSNHSYKSKQPMT